MTQLNLFSGLTAISGLCLALASIAGATVPRAFVSTQGLDTNPCSAVQPCRSFNQALTVVQPGGEIIVQNSGGYSTGFTIKQSVTIDAGWVQPRHQPHRRQRNREHNRRQRDPAIGRPHRRTGRQTFSAAAAYCPIPNTHQRLRTASSSLFAPGRLEHIHS